MKNLKTSIALILAAGSLATAQMDTSSFNIKGGEVFTAGSVHVVGFIQIKGHNDGMYRFLWSKDGGATWIVAMSSWHAPVEDSAVVTYPWTIPDISSNTVRFRACQLAGGEECKDETYLLTSPDFTITNSTGLAEAGTRGAAPSVRYNAATRSLEASFALAAAERVSLQLIDAAGRVAATLMDGRREAGSHRVSVFSNRLESVAGRYVLRLQVGSESFTRTWIGTP
jgi:hypothetical protein